MAAVGAAVMLSCLVCAQEGPQIYNMSFDHWSKRGGAWYPYAADATPSQRIWDTANPGMKAAGIVSARPEYEHVAVPGEGKAAARIESRKVAWLFVAGNLYSGRFIKLVDFKGAETELGVPFAARPFSLSGYYHYIPRKINHTGSGYEDMEGKPDEAFIEVLLTDWTEPYHQRSHIDGFIDSDADPHIIGIARQVIKKGTSGYVRFDVPFEYRSDKMPSYVQFTVTSSRLGGFGTGAVGSVIYIDEFQFNY